MKKQGKAYDMPKAKLRQPKSKMTSNEKRMSMMKKRMKSNPLAKKGK